MFLYHYYPQGCEPCRRRVPMPCWASCGRSIQTALPPAVRRTTWSADAAWKPCCARSSAKKGGKLLRPAPHYLTVERSPFLASWYENCAILRIPAKEFDLATVSFTYGDSHPTFSDRVNDGREYRGTLYTYHEILRVIEKYGLPQWWNPDGALGPERYIEAHVWSDNPIDRYRT